MLFNKEFISSGIILILLFSANYFAQQPLFETGQEAELILGLSGSKTTSSILHHPARVVSADGKLFVTDTRNNRILIWNNIPTTNNEHADVVVGQPDFESCGSGIGADKLNWPVGIYSDGVRLFVTDAENYRVLIWNHIPTSNGEPADIVLGQPDFETVEIEGPYTPYAINWPWDVFFDGQRLYVVSTGAGRVLIWNELPTYNNQPADLVLGQEDLYSQGSLNLGPQDWNLATPRAICTDGNSLAVSDYNFNRILIWNEIPTQNGQPADVVIGQPDFTSQERDTTIHVGALWIREGMLFQAGFGYVRYWNSIPTVNNQPPDGKIGYGDSKGKDIWGVSFDGERLYVADANACRVLIYNSPFLSNKIMADVVLGQPDLSTNIFLGPDGIGTTSGIVSTGEKLLISADNARILIYQNMPTEDEQPADNLISNVFWYEYPSTDRLGPEYWPFWAGLQLWSDGINLYNIYRDTGIQFWESIPKENNVWPDYYICPESNCDEEISIGYAQGLAVWENQKIIVSDTDNERILIWNNIPTATQSHSPDIVLSVPSYLPKQVSTDGERIAVACQEGPNGGGGVLIWNNWPTEDDTPPDFRLMGHPMKFNNVSTVQIYDDILFVADVGYARVCIYDNFPESADAVYDQVIGQENLYDISAGKTRMKFMIPNSLWFDGEMLWIGEHKFADRVLGFKANIEEVPPVGIENLRAQPLSNSTVKLMWEDKSKNERGFEIRYRILSGSELKYWNRLKSNMQNCVVNNLLEATEYEFQVVAVNSFGESEPQSVTVTTLNTGNNSPNIPELVVPEKGIIHHMEHLDFRWICSDPDIGDTLSYDLYFGNCEDPPLIFRNIKNNYYFDPEFGLPGDQVFHWKIKAYDNHGYSNESEVSYFLTAGPFDRQSVLINTSQGGTTIPIPANYDYDSRSIGVVTAIPDSNYVLSHWIVNEDNVYGNPVRFDLSSSKEVTPVFIYAVKPDIPKANTPIDSNKVSCTDIEFDWGPTYSTDTYNFQLAKDFDFTTILVDTTLSEHSLIIPKLSDGRIYYWRVNAANSFGMADYCEPEMFITKLNAPIDLEYRMLSDGKILLEWDDNSESESYSNLERKNITNMGDFIEIDIVTSSSYTDSLVELGNKYSYRVKNFNDIDQSDYSNVIETDVVTSLSDQNLPKEFKLYVNYPNPFNPTTIIRYSIPKTEYVTLRIYDILGNKIADLVNEQKTQGNYEVKLDATNLSSGVYFYKIQAGEFSQVRKMLLIK